MSPKSSKSTRDVTAKIVLAVVIFGILAALLAIFGGREATPTAAPTAPTLLPEVVTADTSACKSGTLLYSSCVSRAQSAAATAAQKNAAQNRTAKAEYERAMTRWQAAEADAAKSWSDRFSDKFEGLGGIIFAVGLTALGGGFWVATRSDEGALRDLPPHRDPHGPGAGAILAERAAGRALGWVWAAVGPVVLLGWASGIGMAVIAAIPAALVIWAVLARYRRMHTTEAGYRIADERWMAAAQEAEMSGQPAPPEPRMGQADARALGLTKGFEAPADSAASVMLDVAGMDGPVRSAWAAIAHALNLGIPDPESGKFTPWADVESTAVLPGGDVEVVFRLSDVTKTAASLKPAVEPLLRELRVKELVGGAFTTRHTDGRIVGRFSNGGGGGAATAVPQAKPDDDDWDF